MCDRNLAHNIPCGSLSACISANVADIAAVVAGAAALVRFEKALLMSQKIADLVLQRRAMRGMAASSRMQGNNQSAIKHLKSVLALSETMKEYMGDADAYGSIADIYADMGDFDQAASYYDQYIQRMQEDGQAI